MIRVDTERISQLARSATMSGRRAAYPRCVDRMGLTAYLRFSAEHDRRIRHFDFIEPPSASPPPYQGHRPREAPALLLSDRLPCPARSVGLLGALSQLARIWTTYPNHILAAYMASGT
jgi:hypothetical protein